MDSNIKRSIIIDNYQNPTNRGLKNNKDSIKVKANNESCIDEIDLEIQITDDKLVNIHFDGEACAICTASTSIMIQKLLNKTKEEAIKIIDEFNNMINEKEYDEKLLGQATAFNEVSKQPNRIKCATLTWNSLKKVLKN